MNSPQPEHLRHAQQKKIAEFERQLQQRAQVIKQARERRQRESQSVSVSSSGWYQFRGDEFKVFYDGGDTIQLFDPYGGEGIALEPDILEAIAQWHDGNRHQSGEEYYLGDGNNLVVLDSGQVELRDPFGESVTYDITAIEALLIWAQGLGLLA